MNTLNTIRPELLSFTSEHARLISPLLWAFGGALAGIVLCMFPRVQMKWAVFAATLLACVGGIAASVALLPGAPTTLFNGMLAADRFGNFFNIVFLACAAFTILASIKYLDNAGLQHPEYYILILFAAMGMMLLTASLDLVVLFIALELMSLAVYTLVGFRRADRKSNEASLKYFILGGAASAILLYGAALLYGVTASTNIVKILEFVKAAESAPGGISPLFVLGSWLVIAGFLFKVAAVPFHAWMPDVYEGAPAPVTAFMTTGLKAASFAAFVRVFSSFGFTGGITEGVAQGFASAFEAHIHDVLWVSAVLTMVVGNVIALTQTNLKRMLAYSSIAHTGYLLVGIVAGYQNDQGYAPVVLYLVSYAVMNLGAFAVLTALASHRDEGLNLHDMAGLSRRHPWLAFAMAVFLFSMAGVPPTAGFIAKYLMFYSAIQSRETLLVIISVLCSAISVYYYLRVLVYMYMRDPVGSVANSRAPGLSLWAGAAVAAMVVLTLQVGLIPNGLVLAAKKAVFGL